MHRKKTAFSLAAFAAFAFALATFSGCTSLLGGFDVAPESGDASTGGKGKGEACQAGGECATGFCADGVCCESACDGTCESCALADKGTCAPIPDGTDPDKECLPGPAPEAGALVEAGATDDGGDLDAGDGGDASSDASVSEAGAINVPDGGFTSADDSCAGSCNGKRQCKFPGAETTCGTKFCNSATESGRFRCDGAGRCELGLEACEAYVCTGDACGTKCTQQADCQSTHFCNGAGMCQAKLGEGVDCTNPNACQSGFCVNGVCCDGACDVIPGGVCNKPGKVGKCQCSIDCGAGSCALFYVDADSDGYGDRTATLANGRAQVACDNAPPAGYVLDHTDCADNDGRAHPGQTDFFGNPPITGTTSHDFNCDGAEEKSIPEYPNASCVFCGAPNACPSSGTCSTAKQGSRLSCALSKGLCYKLGGFQTCYTCGGSLFNVYDHGFTKSVACGDYAYETTCGSCSVVGGTSSSSTAYKQQQCH